MDSSEDSPLRVGELYRGNIDRVTGNGRGIVRKAVYAISGDERMITFQSPTFVCLNSVPADYVNIQVVFRYEGGVRGELVEVRNMSPFKRQTEGNVNKLLKGDL